MIVRRTVKASDPVSPPLPKAGQFARIGAVLPVLPVLVFAWVFSRYAINVPKYDDHALKYFLLYFEKADSLHDKLYALFRQHNEHRIVYDRVVTLLDYWLTGRLDFVHLMVLGNLSLVALLGVFIRVLKRSASPLWMALPVSLLLFNLSQWENMFWGMAALQNFTVIALVMAVFYRIAYQRKADWLTLGLAVAATTTSGNGLLVWPVGLVLVLLNRDFTGTIRWLVALAVTIRLYFFGYEKPPGNPAAKGTISDLLQGWLLFNGAAGEAFPIRNYFLACQVVGLLAVAACLFIGIRALRRHFEGHRLPSNDIFFLGGAAFMVGTGLIVAFNRVGFGMEILITSRYKIYSLTLLGLIFCYAIANSRPSRKVLTAGLAAGFSFLLALFSYSTYLDEIVFLRKFMATFQFNFTYTTNRPVQTIDPVTRRMTRPAPAFYDPYVKELFGSPVPETTFPLDSVFRAGQEFVVRADSLPVLGYRDEGAYLLARSDRRQYLFPGRQYQTDSRRAWVRPARKFISGFTANLPEVDLQPGYYDLFVVTYGPQEQIRMYRTGRRIFTRGASLPPLEKNW
ncbi:hypothetical protein [Larkinella soli]|uniref:hypothetical protein n=1 Tax=Larkinella soli TaxID=1770527 RepID=UPI000FFBF1F9|nr:hypothetical protein [Larkinella soli]